MPFVLIPTWKIGINGEEARPEIRGNGREGIAHVADYWSKSKLLKYS